MSSTMASGFPSCSRCTVMATYVWWLGVVHALVAKFRQPLYFYHGIMRYIRCYCHQIKCYLPYPEHHSDALLHSSEDHADITCNGYWLGYIHMRPSGLHQGKKSTINNDLEWPITLWYPVNYFDSNRIQVSNCTGPWTRRQSPHLSCCWLNAWVCNLSFTNMFKVWCEDPDLMLSNDFACLFKIISIQCRLNNVPFPATNGMLFKVTSWLCISFVKVVMDAFAASFLCTNKLMKWYFITFCVSNLWNWFIEGINRWWTVMMKVLYMSNNSDKSNI